MCIVLFLIEQKSYWKIKYWFVFNKQTEVETIISMFILYWYFTLSNSTRSPLYLFSSSVNDLILSLQAFIFSLNSDSFS